MAVEPLTVEEVVVSGLHRQARELAELACRRTTTNCGTEAIERLGSHRPEPTPEPPPSPRNATTSIFTSPRLLVELIPATGNT
jgi:hypothetical protein